MSTKQITELRKAGRLDEALVLATEALAADPENIWNKRAAAWVYYEHLKKFVEPGAFEEFKENLVNIQELQLPEDEKMVFDKSAWQIGKMVFGLQKQEPVEHRRLNELFEIVKDFHFTKPSEDYSFLYKAFHGANQNWSGYLQFADWWNFENFLPEDGLKEEYAGRQIMALVEKAYIAYSKKLLEGNALDAFGRQKELDKERIESFLVALDAIIKKHPEYQYPPFYKAKLMIAIGGDRDETLSSFLPFAKQKRNDFWVWELMAEIFSDDKEIQFDCYCKALDLKTREDFLVKTRQMFSEMLIDRQMYDEARTEIQKVIAARERENWKIPNQITQWTEQSWYASATPKNDNKALYAKHSKRAEEILFKDIPEDIVAIEFVNANKNILNFVKKKGFSGFFKYSGHLKKPHVGDVVKVRFNGEGKDGFHKIFSARKAEPNEPCDAIRMYKGSLKVIPPQNFGFVDDVFIEPRLVQQKELTDGQVLEGKAILTYNKKKSQWGWKAVSIENEDQ